MNLPVATVDLAPSLRPLAGGARRLVVTGATVGEALAGLAARFPGLGALLEGPGGLAPGLAVFAGEEALGGEALHGPLDGGAELTLLTPIRGAAEDVRMRGFRVRSSVEETLAAALDGVTPLETEAVPVTEAAGRVLAQAVVSEVDVPPFRRATMDGYAVVAADTFGASMYNPVLLPVRGESMPGRGSPGALGSGTAVRIMTGAPVPEGADAVIRAEDAVEAGPAVEVRAPVPAGKNVGRIGEDITRGREVLPAGRRLRPEDAGLLASIGASPVGVHRRPRVRIVVSGNELLAPGERPDAAHIVDSNSVMLAGLVARDGGAVEEVARLPDDRDAISAALAKGGADVIVTAGGVSVGREDFLPMVVSDLGDLLVHGVTMRPSSPTGVGRIGGVPVLLLPGNPVSCLVAYDAFAGPVIRTMTGLPLSMPYQTERRALAGRLVSRIGRTDYARVAVGGDGVRPVAIAGASVLSSVTAADGFVIVPAASEGFPEGTEVEVHRYGTLRW